jgi:hypothetical protein
VAEKAVSRLLAPASPWQNPYVERMIGSIRRELLDHVTGLRPDQSITASDRHAW